MKGAVEYFMVMLLVMFSILLMFNLIGVLAQIHAAHNYRDQVVSLIENYDGDSVEVKREMEAYLGCGSCSYRSFVRDSRIVVMVTYDLTIEMLEFEKQIDLLGMTQITRIGVFSIFVFKWKFFIF